MDSRTASPVDEQQPPVVDSGGGGGGSVGADRRGRHRILAELKRVEQEINSFQRQEQYFTGLSPVLLLQLFADDQEAIAYEELEELDKTDNVSTVCEELLRNVDTRPDPLLPETNGPLNPIWDRWFEGPQESQGCRCWIL